MEESVQKPDVLIVDNKGAPPELVQLAKEAASKCSKVNTVVFDAFMEQLNGDIGAFDHGSGTIIIDMGACIKKKTWITKGVMLIPNVWFNLVFAFFHEMAHAFQLEEDESLGALETLPQEYEDEANHIAEDSLLGWVDDHPIPLLSEMNWVGDQLKELLNKLYSQVPEVVIEELDLNGTNAAANALHVILATGDIEDKEGRAKLLQSIDDGVIGVKINGKRYLTAYESVNTTQSGH